MLRPALATAALLIVPQLAQAQAQQTIDAGAQIQQIPPAPTLDRPQPQIIIQNPSRAADDSKPGPSIAVSALVLHGDTLFSERQLMATTGFTAGTYDLHQLRQFAARITDYYNQHGYFLAQAYLPAQDINGGTVTINVVEGHYGEISLRNASSLQDGVAHNVLDGLNGDVVTTAPLERRLLLLSEIPGVAVRSTLSPGAAVGTTNLIVDVTQARRFNGSVEADNGGNRFTGNYRFGASLNWNNPTGHGDMFSLRALGSTSGLGYGRAAYQRLFGVATLGVAYSHIHYELGREFKALDASGTADVASLFTSYPLVRSRRANLYALGGLDAKWFTDRQRAFSTENHRRTTVVSLGLSGNSLDQFAGGGANSFSVGVSGGDLNLLTPADRVIDQATARAEGHYAKLQASFAREQKIAGSVSLYGSLRGQLASKNLDSSEKIELGGPYAVRAYPDGEAFGDEGYVATAEARATLPVSALPGRVQLIGFVDVGEVRLAKDPWFTGPNNAHRSGAGVGLNWTAPNNFLVQATYARKLNNQSSTLFDDGKGRFWFRVAKLF